MADFLHHLGFWDWLGLGILLLILEVFGAGGYLLWIGIAAAITGVIAFLIPGLDWTWQFLLFGVLAILTAVFWWRHQRSAKHAGGSPGLNRRGSELVGRQFALHDAIVGGRGKIRVGDSVWLVSGPELPAGAQVRVTGQDGVLLLVEPA
ncbi:NfeD family protein [Pseudomonas sp. NY15181]|uniref:NfeD family protein n=1 Tax=Pseudomonas sp. NY15181 TaxID=3400349 RepID=UPI003A8920C1